MFGGHRTITSASVVNTHTMLCNDNMTKDRIHFHQIIHDTKFARQTGSMKVGQGLTGLHDVVIKPSFRHNYGKNDNVKDNI